MNNQKSDAEIWKEAKRRARFKIHLRSYVLVNLAFWGLWWFTSQNHELAKAWPLYLNILWGVGLIIDAVRTHLPKESTIAKQEYEKLKDKP